VKKELLIISIILFSFLLVSNIVVATPIYNDDGSDGFEDLIDTGGTSSPYSTYVNSGFLLGTNSGNNLGSPNNRDEVEALVEDWLGFTTAAQRADFTFTDTSNVALTYTDGLKSGTWAVVPATDVISFYAIKGDNAFAMYQVIPAQNTGSWSTFDLLAYHSSDSLSISHYTGYNQSTSAPVPEPTTILLFGTGLIGLAGISRRRK